MVEVKIDMLQKGNFGNLKNYMVEIKIDMVQEEFASL